MTKADELAHEEAEEILEHVEGSARSRRHERLSRLREQASVEMDHEDEDQRAGTAKNERQDSSAPSDTGSQNAAEANLVADEEESIVGRCFVCRLRTMG